MRDFFPPRPGAAPTIYAYASTHPDHKGLLKVGYTERNAAQRIVRLAAPFPPLPAEAKVDELYITRTWQFLPGGVLRSK